MRDLTKVGLVLIGLGASVALIQCAGDDESSVPPNNNRTTGTAGSTGASGSNGSGGGNGASGSNGGSSNGASGNNGASGSGGSNGGSAGTSGTGGAGGSSGGAGSAGNTGGQAGMKSEAGAPDANTDAAETAADSGSAAADAEAGPIVCNEETTGASDASTGVRTAIVLIDSVVIKDGGNTNVVAQWQFDDATTIEPGLPGSRPGDKWSRPPYSSIDTNGAARNDFLACDGNPAVGSLKTVVPFSADAQYFETSVLFAEHAYPGYHITAKVKLVTGGRPDAACPGHALLYVVDNDADAGYPQSAGTPSTLVAGQWQDVSLNIAATGFAHVAELGVRITTYACQ